MESELKQKNIIECDKAILGEDGATVKLSFECVFLGCFFACKKIEEG